MLDPNNRRTWGTVNPAGGRAEEEDDEESGAVAAGGASARSEPQWAKLQRPRTRAAVEVPLSGRDTVEIQSRGASAARARATFAKTRGIGLGPRERDHMLIEVLADVVDEVGGVRKALHEWDSDGDGAVTGADLLRAMQSAGAPMSEEDCARIAAATDSTQGESAVSEGFLAMGTIVRLLRFDLALPSVAPVGGGTSKSSRARPAHGSLDPAQSQPQSVAAGRSHAAAPGAGATPESRVAGDRAMLKMIQAAIDDNGGQRRLFRKWDTNGSRGLSAAQLHAGVNQMYDTTISLESCARITNAFGTGTLSMGELVRVLGGDIPLPAMGVARPAPGSGTGPGAKRSLYPRSAHEEESDATLAAGATSVEFAAGVFLFTVTF